MKPRTIVSLKRALVMAAVGISAAATSYGTAREVYPSVASRQTEVWVKALAITTSSLTKAAAEGVHRAVIAAVVGPARSATRNATYLGKSSVQSAGTPQASGCPLCKAGLRICPKRSSVHA